MALTSLPRWRLPGPWTTSSPGSGDLELTGDGGFIPGLIKAALERGLQAELSDHLGYEKGSAEASLFANSRNGATSKTLASQVGEVPLDVPRDRDRTFIPRLVPKGSRRLGGLDEMIISLYAGGMTLRDIQHHLATTIGTELSHETISKITDEIDEEILAWQRRPLESLYPVIYLDALVVKVRDGAHVINKAAHIAVGVDMDGIKNGTAPARRTLSESLRISPLVNNLTTIWEIAEAARRRPTSPTPYPTSTARRGTALPTARPKENNAAAATLAIASLQAGEPAAPAITPPIARTSIRATAPLSVPERPEPTSVNRRLRRARDSSEAFEEHRLSLSAANAHRLDGERAVDRLQRVQHRRQDP
ncbi:hypothetical protein J2S59_003469 [Nocardioides massiliensis]|uniref:Mutator family transposase n=1 Tax=Nocardioides massiliensis TaxID=1325935 RepID=A0ABT9NTB2_9ACTN|nr:hypothetical protein [Nocardioides massiliensis]